MAKTGAERREDICRALREARGPLPGAAIARMCGVSRQVVVQDIALLRTQGLPIVATTRGYLLNRPPGCRRLFKCFHDVEQTEVELQAIVDAGGTVEDVIVNHRAYGKMSVPLGISSRSDVERFMHDIRTGKSSPLMTVTSGYHFHHVSAASEEALDEIAATLERLGFRADFLPYEVDAID